jgi:inner membrane protein
MTRGMASIGHVAVGLLAAREWTGLPAWSAPAAAAAWIGLSLLPDADVVAFALGIPYDHPFGHRGASHALGPAAACGLAVTLAARRGSSRRRAGRLGMLVAAVLASHGLLDALTDGGLGIALLWPVTSERYFAPWQPIPVAPIGLGMLSERGLYVLLTELVQFAPLLVVALRPPARSRRAQPAPQPPSPNRFQRPSSSG